MQKSLRWRQFRAASLVLAGFLGLTGMALERAFEHSAEAALRLRLESRIYALLAVAESQDSGPPTLAMHPLPDPAFAQPGSGIYAVLRDRQRKVVWRSPSLVGQALDWPDAERPGDIDAADIVLPDGHMARAASLRVLWEAGGREAEYTLSVAESRVVVDAEIAVFRKHLWFWLGAVTLALMGVLIVLVNWALRPVRRLGMDLKRIEAGTAERLMGNYPKELAPLADQLNGFIAREKARLERYRQALGDLAHSLKTPLAVLRTTASGVGSREELARTVETEVGRMNEIVSYRLSRAAAAGGTVTGRLLAVAPTARRIVHALERIHVARHLRFEVDLPDTFTLPVESGDLSEVLGNLLDNAAKWARSRVRIAGGKSPDAREFSVEDDGPGFPGDMTVARGQRADSTVPGHGLGLSLVADIVADHGGRLELGRSVFGGGKVTVVFPRGAGSGG